MNEELRDFDESKRIGKIGEDAFIKFLIKCGYHKFQYVFDLYGKWYIDVRDNEFYRECDVDFIIHNGKETFGIDVKTDAKTYRTGNIFAETKLTTEKGWLYRSLASVIIYCTLDAKENPEHFYSIDLNALRLYDKEHNFPEKKCNKKQYTEGKKIPLQPLITLGIAKQIK